MYLCAAGCVSAHSDSCPLAAPLDTTPSHLLLGALGRNFVYTSCSTLLPRHNFKHRGCWAFVLSARLRGSDAAGPLYASLRPFFSLAMVALAHYTPSGHRPNLAPIVASPIQLARVRHLDLLNL